MVTFPNICKLEAPESATAGRIKGVCSLTTFFGPNFKTFAGDLVSDDYDPGNTSGCFTHAKAQSRCATSKYG